MAKEIGFLKGSLDLMVLSVLSEGPSYGYEIQKRLDKRSGGMVHLQIGPLYRLLHQLEDKGAIASWIDESTGRKRKWYKLTEMGEKRLHRGAIHWKEYADCLLEVLRPAFEQKVQPKSSEA